ncbi:hypothetical protein ACJIZ3_003985 [Penstemon smallii]|uniref:Uncharacterized protein n=1 Tax=Penstemon smallii TaxID=265156 RepID=A0ABD3S0W3_9LAMI
MFKHKCVYFRFYFILLTNYIYFTVYEVSLFSLSIYLDISASSFSKLDKFCSIKTLVTDTFILEHTTKSILLKELQKSPKNWYELRY